MTEFEYVRPLGLAALLRTAEGGRLALAAVLGHDNGADKCLVNAIVVPPDCGSPDGRHVHDSEQIFCVLAGTLSFEIDDQCFRVPAGHIAVAPAGVPHRSWNDGPQPVQLLSFNTPPQDPGQPLARPVSD